MLRIRNRPCTVIIHANDTENIWPYNGKGGAEQERRTRRSPVDIVTLLFSLQFKTELHMIRSIKIRANLGKKKHK